MDWSSKMPSYISQYSYKCGTDYEDCSCFSLIHILYALTGRLYSTRALAKMAGITKNGISNVGLLLPIIKNQGLVLEQLWSSDPNYTWNDYYQSLPSVITEITDRYDIQLIPKSIEISPIWTEIQLGGNGPYHMVCQVQDTGNPTDLYFDSEVGAPFKPLNYDQSVIRWQSSVIANPISVQDWYVKSTDFAPEQWNAFTPDVQAAIKFNDNGGHNVILNGQLVGKDPNYN
jgi:hypothetical protein